MRSLRDHDFVAPQIQREIAAKFRSGCAGGILNSPDEADTPETDPSLEMCYTPVTHRQAKKINKIAFQSKTGLVVDQNAPLLFWPNRLDPVQKGCQLLAEIMYDLVHRYYDRNLQIAIVANGSYQKVFRDIVAFHDFYDRVTVCDFDEKLSHLAFAASDFVLVPSRFEPCGLPQMTAQYYGSLPIVRDTGGLHDTVEHWNFAENTGNGFVFRDYDANGLRWAVDEAMKFHALPEDVREQFVSRVMNDARRRFNHDVTARHYINIYESMLARPLLRK